MEKKFVIPAVSFLAGLFTWVAFFVVYLKGNWIQALAPWAELGLCLGAGVLVLFSAVMCYRAGGPRAGGFVRSGSLLLMALLTFWKVGEFAAGVLLLAGLAAGAMAFMGSGDSATDSEQSSGDAK